MSDMCGLDHDLGRYTADIDAGAANGAALDQRDVCASLDGFQRRSHSRATAADNGYVQWAFAATVLLSEPCCAGHSVQHVFDISRACVAGFSFQFSRKQADIRIIWRVGYE